MNSDSENIDKTENSEPVVESDSTISIEKKDSNESVIKTDTSNWKTWIDHIELFKTLSINFVIIFLIGSIIFIFYTEWQREPIVIEPFAVPEGLVEQGYSGTVLNSRLMDHLSANQEASYNRLPDNQKYLFPIEVTNSDLGNTLNIDIPETGLSLNMIIQYVRQLRGAETRISGDLVGDEDDFELTVRVNGKPKAVKGKLATLDENLDELAAFIIENTQPYFLALHYYGEKDYEKALELVQKTLHNKDKRDDSFAYDLWGNILTRKKQYEAAIEKYNESIKINPDNDNPYIGLAYVYYIGYKDYDAAIRNYKKVIGRDKENYSAYNDMALVLADKGDTKAAIENYKKAIEVNPDYAIAHYNLGLIFLSEKDYKQADIQFNKIIELPYNASNYFKAYNGLCYSLSQENKYEDAIKNCELGIKIRPKDDNIYDTLGTAFVTRKDYKNAQLNYQTAVNLNPDNSEAQLHLADVLAITGQCKEANIHLQLALQLDNLSDTTTVQKYCEGDLAKPQ